MRYIIFILFLLSACGGNDTFVKQDVKGIDTLIEQSIKLADSSIVVLHLADKQTQLVITKTIQKFEYLENTNAQLKNEVRKLKENTKVKTVVIRDTIYITEKKNFWGKKKVKIDSTQQSVVADSTLNEN